MKKNRFRVKKVAGLNIHMVHSRHGAAWSYAIVTLNRALRKQMYHQVWKIDGPYEGKCDGYFWASKPNTLRLSGSYTKEASSR
jgi:hypothetical protein